MNGHYEYEIKTVLNNSGTELSARQRFTAFENLFKLLCMRYPLEAIPPIAAKDKQFNFYKEGDERIATR